MRFSLVLLLLLALAGLAWIRFAPSDPARWNSDPRTAQVRDGAGWVVLPAGGNEPGRVYRMTPEALMEKVAGVAADWPRTRLVVRDGLRATWVSRTKWMGFPDYTTIEAVPDEGGARLLINARQRYGMGDHGVNRARVRAWLRALESRVEADEAANVGG